MQGDLRQHHGVWGVAGEDVVSVGGDGTGGEDVVDGGGLGGAVAGGEVVREWLGGPVFARPRAGLGPRPRRPGGCLGLLCC